MYCGIIEKSSGEFVFEFPYTKKTDTAYWILALNDQSLNEIENKAVEMLKEKAWVQIKQHDKKNLIVSKKN